jgi:hypothetical protein
MLQTRDYVHAMLSTLVIVAPADVEEMAASRKLRAERLHTGARPCSGRAGRRSPATHYRADGIRAGLRNLIDYQVSRRPILDGLTSEYQIAA